MGLITCEYTMKITVKAGQTLADIAVVHTGSMEALMNLSLANGMSLTEKLTAGQVLESTDVMRREVVTAFASSYSQPAMEITSEDEGKLSPGGIGHMAVEVDFVVS